MVSFILMAANHPYGTVRDKPVLIQLAHSGMFSLLPSVRIINSIL